MLKTILKEITRFFVIIAALVAISASAYFIMHFQELKDSYIKNRTESKSAKSNLEDTIFNPFDQEGFEKSLRYGSLDCKDFRNNEMAGPLFNMINADRQKDGKTVLKWNERLCESAKLKAGDMASVGYFDHMSPSGISPNFWIEKEGYKFKFSGENLAVNAYNPKECHKVLMKSQGHRENILDSDFDDVGIGYAWGKLDGKEAFFIVEHFGSPAP